MITIKIGATEEFPDWSNEAPDDTLFVEIETDQNKNCYGAKSHSDAAVIAEAFLFGSRSKS